MDLRTIAVLLTISSCCFLRTFCQFPFPGPYPQVVLPPYPGGRGLPFLPLPPPFIPSLPQLYPTYIRAGGVPAPRYDQNRIQLGTANNQVIGQINSNEARPGGIPVKFPSWDGHSHNTTQNETNVTKTVHRTKTVSSGASTSNINTAESTINGADNNARVSGNLMDLKTSATENNSLNGIDTGRGQVNGIIESRLAASTNNNSSRGSSRVGSVSVANGARPQTSVGTQSQFNSQSGPIRDRLNINSGRIRFDRIYNVSSPAVRGTQNTNKGLENKNIHINRENVGLQRRQQGLRKAFRQTPVAGRKARNRRIQPATVGQPSATSGYSSSIPQPKLRRIYVFRFKNNRNSDAPADTSGYGGTAASGNHNVPRVVVRPSYAAGIEANKKREAFQQKTSIRRLTPADRKNTLSNDRLTASSGSPLSLPFERLSLKYPNFLKSQRDGKKKGFKHIKFKTDLETGRIKIKRPPGFELMNEAAKTNSVPTAENVKIVRTSNDTSPNNETAAATNSTKGTTGNKSKLIEEIGNFIDLAQKLNIDLGKLLHEEKKPAIQRSMIIIPTRAESRGADGTITGTGAPSKFILLTRKHHPTPP